MDTFELIITFAYIIGMVIVAGAIGTFIHNLFFGG
jgi:hypothetical protein